jgi:hypothetical protein
MLQEEAAPVRVAGVVVLAAVPRVAATVAAVSAEETAADAAATATSVANVLKAIWWKT